MRILKPGHRYALTNLDGERGDEQILQFVQRQPFHDPLPGTTSQEVLRALIDRVSVLDKEKPWNGNKRIIANLREAIGLHECRALMRHIEDGKIHPEQIQVGHDGHFLWVTDWIQQGFPEAV